MREPSVAVPWVAFRVAHGQDRPPAENPGSPDRLGGCETAVSERARRPDDPRANPADSRVESLLRSPGERSRGGDARDVSVNARTDCDGAVQQATPAQGADGIGEGHGQGATGKLEVSHFAAIANPSADRRELVVERAANH